LRELLLKDINTTYKWKHTIIPTTVIKDAVGIVKTLYPGRTDAAKHLSTFVYDVCSTTIEIYTSLVTVLVNHMGNVIILWCLMTLKKVE